MINVLLLSCPYSGPRLFEDAVETIPGRVHTSEAVTSPSKTCGDPSAHSPLLEPSSTPQGEPLYVTQHLWLRLQGTFQVYIVHICRWNRRLTKRKPRLLLPLQGSCIYESVRLGRLLNTQNIATWPFTCWSDCAYSCVNIISVCIHPWSLPASSPYLTACNGSPATNTCRCYLLLPSGGKLLVEIHNTLYCHAYIWGIETLQLDIDCDRGNATVCTALQKSMNIYKLCLSSDVCSEGQSSFTPAQSPCRSPAASASSRESGECGNLSLQCLSVCLSALAFLPVLKLPFSPSVHLLWASLVTHSLRSVSQ